MEVAQVVQDMLDNMVLSRAQTALALTDDQYPLFFRRMQAYQRLQHQHQMRRLRLIQEIDQLTKPGVTTADDVLAERTKALDDLEADMARRNAQALTAIDQTISVRQRARLRVFLEEHGTREDHARSRRRCRRVARPRAAAASNSRIPSAAPAALTWQA